MQAIERAFAVLHALRSADGSAGVSSVARTTGLPKSTVSRLLSSLEDVGVVERIDPVGTYAIGPGLVTLAGGASSVVTLREVARPHLRDLAESLEESAGLTVPDGPSALYVDHVAFDSSVRTRDWTGIRFPYHTVAGGLAMLTTWSETSIDKLVDRGLETYSDETITTKKGLESRLERGRRDGYVWTVGDFDIEINGVAAPVRNINGYAVGAVSVYGPSYRFPGERDPDRIGQAVRKISRLVQDQSQR
jgi:DNA-binding IclR family transcriptional regulator